MGPPGGSKPPGPPAGNSNFENVHYPDERPPQINDDEEENYFHSPPQSIPQLQPSTFASQDVRQRPPQDVRRRPMPDQQPGYEHHPGYNQQPGYNQRPRNNQQPQSLPKRDVDSTDGGHTRLNVNLRYEQTQDAVKQSTPNIFTSFVVDRMQRDGYDVPSQIKNRNMGNNEKKIAQVLQRIGDDMSNNQQLNHLLGSMKVTPDTAYKTFVSVAAQIFQDGNINWGRIVTLFFFAYKLAVQVMNQLPLVDIVIGWVTKFVAERLARWIWNRGGWGAVREYFGATSAQLFAVFAAGFALSTLFWWLKK